VPEGAIPKDGPSAGIAMATSIASALMRKKVRADLAMTGEITLRGRVLPIGGLKEKLLAAHRGNIKTVIIPKDNERDLAEVPQNVQKALKIIFVEHIDEVLKIAFIQDEENIGETVIADVPISSQSVN
jgi:ATP-dependent Lon protease